MPNLAASPSPVAPSVQLALAGMPGGVQLEWGLRALQLAQKRKRDAPNDPRQGALPGFGVLPGALWREHSAAPTGLERLPAEYLELRRPRRQLDWTEGDLKVRLETRARSVTLATAMRWRTGAGVPPWFVGFVPKRLRLMLSIVWTAYRRGAFGVRDTQPSWAAALDTCTRTIRTHMQLGVELGLLSSVQLWVEHQGSTRRCVILLRPGPLLEAFAGIAAFEFSKARAVDMRASFPGSSSTVHTTKGAARARARALLEASRRFHADQRSAMYEQQPRERSCPEVFGRYLGEVLSEEVEVRVELETMPSSSNKPKPAPRKKPAAAPPHRRESSTGSETPQPQPSPESSRLLLAWCLAASRSEPSSPGSRSAAHGGPSSPTRSGTKSATPSRRRKKVPNKHGPSLRSGPTVPVPATPEEKEAPPCAADRLPGLEGSLRDAARHPEGATAEDSPHSPQPTSPPPGGDQGGEQLPCPACRDVGLIGGCHRCGRSAQQGRRLDADVALELRQLGLELFGDSAELDDDGS